MLVFALFLLCLAVGGCEDDSIPIAMTLCGERLAQTREQFCLEAGLLMQKRSVVRDENADALAGWPFLGPESPNALLKRRKRGIVDECCFNPCTRNDLLSYC